MARLMAGRILLVVAFATFGAHALAEAERVTPRDTAKWQTVRALARDGDHARWRSRDLERLPGPGNERTADQVVAAMSASGHAFPGGPAVRQAGDTLFLSMERWTLEVSGEGRSVRLVRDPATLRPRSPEESMSEQVAVARAQELVDQFFGDVVVRAEGEELVPMRVSYHRQGFQPMAEGRPIEGAGHVAILAMLVQFARLIDGIPVIGVGSRATIAIGMDGELAGADIDWSQFGLASSTRRPVASAAVRASRLEVLKTKMSIAESVGLDLCGYFDSGSRSKDEVVTIQLACLYRTQVRPGVFGRSLAVPIEAQLRRDAGWSESMLLP